MQKGMIYFIFILIGVISSSNGMEEPGEPQGRTTLKTPEFDQETQNLIMRYCYAGQVDTLLKGVLKVQDSRGNTTVHAAAQSETLKALQLLTELADNTMSVTEKNHFMNSKDRALGEVSAFTIVRSDCTGAFDEVESKKRAALLQHLLKNGLDPESSCTGSEDTLLMEAAYAGDVQCAKLIVEAIEQKYDSKKNVLKALNATNRFNQNALWFAEECETLTAEAMQAYLKSKGMQGEDTSTAPDYGFDG